MIDFQSRLFPRTFKSIGLAFILLISPAIHAQDTTYYSADWSAVSRSEASFFFTPPSEISSPSPASITVETREIPKFQFDFPFLKAQDLIGKKVAVWSSGPTYTTLYLSQELDWPADDSIFYGIQPPRKKHTVWCGDTARIVWVFERFHERNGARVYIVKARKGYEVIGGSGLTMPDVLKPPPPPSPPQPPTPLWLTLNGGGLFQRRLGGEFALLLALMEANHDGYFFAGAKAGVEMLRTGSVGYKLGCDLDLMFLSLNAGVMAIPADHGTDWRALPEIGINFLYVSLTYGYAYHLAGPRDRDFGNHRAALRIYAPLWNVRPSAKRGS